MRFLTAGRPFLVAEAGVNHNGRVELAFALVDAAARAGADAVKFQTFIADKLVCAEAATAAYQSRALGKESTQREMLRALELSQDDHRVIATRCREKNIHFMSTPFDEESADFLASLGMNIFKIPSGEITNHRLLTHLAGIKKPLILSTGMSTLEEVVEAVAVLRRGGATEIIVLHCTSSYPTDDGDANLLAMESMADVLKLPVGFSDHTRGIDIAIAAAALGACVIEKHFTLDKTLPGPDHAMSLTPIELGELSTGIRRAAAARGDGIKRPVAAESETRRLGRRSVVLSCFVKAGTTLTDKMLVLKRPATGIPANDCGKVVGRRLKRDLSEDTILQWDMVEEPR